MIRHVRTPVLDVACEIHGPAAGPPVVLLHGFPYDPRCFDAVLPALAGCRVVVPYLRGYGGTRFLSDATPRSGQQAALAHDLLELLDARGIGQAVLAGYDWGGRAACIVGALWPGRVCGLVTCGGYNVQDIAGSVAPRLPDVERRLWYQYYFHTERGRAGLAAHRAAFCEQLWRLWSPLWRFEPATYAASAASFGNADFVDVVVQSYRHRFGYAPGDPAYEGTERALAGQPDIAMPTINLVGTDDGVAGPVPDSDTDAAHFVGRYERRVLHGIGHNVPQEAPGAFASAVRTLLE